MEVQGEDNVGIMMGEDRHDAVLLETGMKSLLIYPFSFILNHFYYQNFDNFILENQENIMPLNIEYSSNGLHKPNEKLALTKEISDNQENFNEGSKGLEIHESR